MIIAKIKNTINRILNISSREWPRVIVSWSMIFFARFGFIVGWSVLMATFLSKVGVNYLPYLFMANALLVVIGTFSYRKIIHIVRREVLISGTILSAAALLISSVIFLKEQSFLFFTFLLIAESIFLAQLNILISLFNEELFNPLESQRTFPVVESAETIGGICGGLALSLFANTIPSYKFIVIWALALLLIMPIVLRFNARTMMVPKLKDHEKNKETGSWKKQWKELRKTPFLKGLMLVIVLHWAMINIIEFQYTTAIQEEVFNVQQETLILADEGYSEEQLAMYEQQIAAKLGTLHVIFNSITLFIQLLLASRIITRLGVVSSMLVHPLLTLLNLIGMTLRFDLLTAALTRGGYELTGLMFKNSYDSSYYAIPRKKRDEVKEILQGVMKPIGAIMGTFMIMLVALNLQGVDQTLTLNLILLAMGVVMAILIFRLNPSYTDLSEKNLSKKIDLPTRLNAIEILGQKGHKRTPASLQKILNRENEPIIVKATILKTLGEKADPESVSCILEALHDPAKEVRRAATKALIKVMKNDKAVKKHHFTRYRIIEKLKLALQEEDEERIRKDIIKVFHQISSELFTEYIMEQIKNDSKRKHEFIRTLKMFNDPNLKYYLEPHLTDKNPEIRAAAVVALWQFKALRTKLLHVVRQMLEGKRNKSILAGIKVTGDLKIKSLRKTLDPYVESKNNEIHEAAILSLAKLEDQSIVPQLLYRMLSPNHHWFENTREILKELPSKFRDLVEHHHNSYIHEKIHRIIQDHQGLFNMNNDTLNLLKTLYEKINAHHEVHMIQVTLDSREEDSL